LRSSASWHDHVVAAADEHLAQQRFLLAHGGRHGMSRLTGTSRQPSSTWPSALMARSISCSQASRGGMFLGQEDHADAVFARRGQRDALLGHLFAVQVVGQLDQDARAVAHQLVGAHGAAVVEVLEDLQALQHDRVALLALDVCNEADAAASCSSAPEYRPCSWRC
jgi:hypothetical protein